MAKQQNKHWFKTKRFGWGWYPATWQGWIVLLIYLLFIFIISFENPNIFVILGSTIFATSVLIWICAKTGEKPRWRWGK